MSNDNAHVFNIAAEFSQFPGGRLKKHGPRSGEEFRDDYLIPLIERHKHLVIDFTGAAGYPASFLDEAFGELGKRYGTSYLKEHVELRASDDPTLVQIVWEKIEAGAAERSDNEDQ